MKIHSSIIILSLVALGCGSGQQEVASTVEAPVMTLDAALTLQAYLGQHADRERHGDLIACAAGGHVGFMIEGAAPTSVFFYPVEGATDFRYFETDSLSADPADYTLYKEVKKEVAPVFNGYLRRFVTDYTDRDTWVVVTYLTEGNLHMSGHVRLKITTKPTEFNPGLLAVETASGKPVFAWEDGRTPENAIYFEVVSDLENNLISGTYTHDRNWTFYDTSNVTTNIRDVTPPPSLISGQNYNFTLMAVSQDNWVNLIIRKEFTAP